jgi:hypothetical protein
MGKRALLAALCGALIVSVASAPAAAQAAQPQTPAAAAAPQQPAPAQPAAGQPVRDAVGDMNADSIREGAFPGSLLIPGPGGVSIGLGGFVKTLAIYDTKAEGREAVFLPALLGGIGRDDRDGTFTLTAELTRLNFDVRADVGETKVRGYVEFDFSGDLFKWRHGYLTWSGGFGELLAGKSWSTLMDLQAMPDGLGEPTVSGLIFTRQAQIRYSRAAGHGVKFAVSVEDSASNDVVAPEPVLTRNGYPDIIGTVSVGSSAAHLQVGGVVRSIEFDPNDGGGDKATGGGVVIGAHVNLGSRDRLFGSFSYGKGLGRYLVGIAPSAGAFIDVDSSQVLVRENVGGFGGFRHQWNSSCRSSLVYSYAQADNDPRQPAGAFHDSSFTLANLLCKANRFLTIGAEIDYGTRANMDGSTKDNLRTMVGFQLF